jgi:predicted TIM-barrel fold metal-dependent hydrolase
MEKNNLIEYVDAFLPVGRINRAAVQSPREFSDALKIMDDYFVKEALVYSTVALNDPELNNITTGEYENPRVHKIWAFDPAYVVRESPEQFLQRALKNKAKAIMANPLMRDWRVDRSPRFLELAQLLEKRKIPLLLVHRAWDSGQDVIDWYQMIDFCNRFPNLPVITWEWRSRANRPLFDALSQADNLKLSLSSIWQSQMVRQICEAFGAKRLIFSLGLPFLNPGSFQGVVQYAAIPDSDKQAIASGNIQKILREADYA